MKKIYEVLKVFGHEQIIDSVNIERLQNHPVIISKDEFNGIFDEKKADYN